MTGWGTDPEGWAKAAVGAGAGAGAAAVGAGAEAAVEQGAAGVEAVEGRAASATALEGTVRVWGWQEATELRAKPGGRVTVRAAGTAPVLLASR